MVGPFVGIVVGAVVVVEGKIVVVDRSGLDVVGGVVDEVKSKGGIVVVSGKEGVEVAIGRGAEAEAVVVDTVMVGVEVVSER